MGLLVAVVNTKDLLMTIGASFVAGLGVAFVSSLAIWGGAKYVDFNQEDRNVAALMSLAVGIFGLLSTIGIIVLGIYLMVSK